MRCSFLQTEQFLPFAIIDGCALILSNELLKTEYEIKVFHVFSVKQVSIKCFYSNVKKLLFRRTYRSVKISPSSGFPRIP